MLDPTLSLAKNNIGIVGIEICIKTVYKMKVWSWLYTHKLFHYKNISNIFESYLSNFIFCGNLNGLNPCWDPII